MFSHINTDSADFRSASAYFPDWQLSSAERSQVLPVFFTASSPVSRSTMKVNGTNVINDTSLVMIILKMKHNSTNTSANCMVFCVCRNSVFAILRKTPSFCKPAITVIRQKRIESVRKSIYPAYSLSGGIITADTIANRIATVRTVSLFRNSLSFLFTSILICSFALYLTNFFYRNIVKLRIFSTEHVMSILPLCSSASQPVWMPFW